MRLLLTRQPAQAGALEAGLRGADVGGAPLEVGFLPLTDFALPADAEPLRAVARAVAEPGARGVLVVTSPNAVRAMAAVGWDGTLGPDVDVATTGPGTARALAQAGCRAEPWSPEDDRSAEGILAGLGELAPSRAWLPQSSRARPLLADGLRAAGWEVRQAVAYETVPYPAPRGRRLLDLDPGRGRQEADRRAGGAPGADVVVTPGELRHAAPGTAVLLTSSSAAEEFAAEGLRDVARDRLSLLAIGEPTRRTAADLRLPLAGACVSPDAAGVLAALRSLQD